jgi:hypothetical protein
MEMILIKMEITRKIEAYLDGSLEVDERYELDCRAQKDKELADLIQLYREVNECIREKELFIIRGKLHKILSEKPLFYNKSKLIIAATVLFLVGMEIADRIFIFRNQSGQLIFKNYYVRYESEVVTRSSEIVAHDLKEALLQYELRNYPYCAHLLDSISFQEKDNYMALFYKGLTFLELQKPLDAINAFLIIPQRWNSPYAVHRDWYLALSYIDVQKEKEATDLLRKLVENKTFYSKRAKSILHKLRKIPF